MRTLMSVVCVFVLTGCLYIHDSDLQKTAEDAQADFKAAISDGTSERILESKGNFDKAAQNALASSDARDLEVQLSALPSQPWKEIINETNLALTAAQDKRKSVQNDLDETQKHLAATMANLEPAVKETSSTLEALNAAALAEGRYAATQSLIREGLKAVLQESSSVDDLKKALDERVNIRSFNQAADGTLTEVAGSKSVGELLGINTSIIDVANGKPSIENARKLFDAVKGTPKIDLIKNLDFEHPGIATTILGLGYDVARAEEQRIEAEIASAKARFNLQKRYLNLLDDQISHLQLDPIVETGPDDVTRLGGRLDEPVGVTLETYSQGPKSIARRQSLAIMMANLATNYKYRVVVPSSARTYEDQLAKAESDRALATVAVNLHEREAVISRGLEGLVAFHRGGISSDDVANILRLAQAVGLFAIAGGWL
jgi:hypothetical protein